MNVFRFVVLFSIERYYASVKPEAGRILFSKARCVKYIGVVAVASFILSVPHALVQSYHPDSAPPAPRCAIGKSWNNITCLDTLWTTLHDQIFKLGLVANIDESWIYMKYNLHVALKNWIYQYCQSHHQQTFRPFRYFIWSKILFTRSDCKNNVYEHWLQERAKWARPLLLTLLL